MRGMREVLRCNVFRPFLNCVELRIVVWASNNTVAPQIRSPPSPTSPLSLWPSCDTTLRFPKYWNPRSQHRRVTLNALPKHPRYANHLKAR